MADGVIIRSECSFYFLYKKHLCPVCQNTMARKKREKIVNSHSDEAKYYDFIVVDTPMLGDIKFITYYWECPHCKKVHDVKELKFLEKEKRREKRKRIK